MITINLNKEVVVTLKWVMKALSKTGDRPVLEYISVEPGCFVATNCFVLNVAPIPDALVEYAGKLIKPIKTLSPGPNLFEVDEESTFPNWPVCFPNTNREGWVWVDPKELVKITPGTEAMQLSTFGPNQPVIAQGDHGFSLIMPYLAKGQRPMTWNRPPIMTNAWYTDEGLAVRADARILDEDYESVTVRLHDRAELVLRGEYRDSYLEWRNSRES
jgi:hypothetical protein